VAGNFGSRLEYEKYPHSFIVLSLRQTFSGKDVIVYPFRPQIIFAAKQGG